MLDLQFAGNRPVARSAARWAWIAAAALLLVMNLPPAAAAHSGITVGPYELELAWRSEPAVVGRSNAVQVTIINHETGQPVTDLATGDLVVTVATAGRDSSTLSLAPAFNDAAGDGTLGTYEAPFVPDAAGEYTFQVTGSIHGTIVDGTLENSVEAGGAEPEQGPDPVVLVGGGLILALLAGMAFLLIRVRPAPAR